MNTIANIEIYPVGECAVTLANVGPVSVDFQSLITQFAAILRASSPFYDIVPGMNNVTVIFDPAQQQVESAATLLRQAWQQVTQAAVSARNSVARIIDIPVIYGGEDGPDLQEVAALHHLSIEEVAARHASGEYSVFFVGFQPGFAYLGGLDASLHTPRRAEPRLSVPAGSVGIGGAQTGIYPKSSPGGWQLIGRTESVLFDPYREEPALLLPGDRVRFCIQDVIQS